ncbi:MAG: hypothetical protein ACPGRX_03035 [Bdellovibrionales bacterium]
MSKKTKIPQFFINAFYESKFRDNLFVIKAGGKVIEDQKALDALLSDIYDLNNVGIKVLLIYGGGRAMDSVAAERGIEVQKIDGRRVTDAASLEVMKHVVGGTLSLGVAQGLARLNMDGLSFNVVPFDWMKVELRNKKPVDFGFVGTASNADPRPIQRLFKVTNFIACSCMAITKDGTLCNINADTIATQLAIGLKAHKLVFLSDVDGVKIDGKTRHLITDQEIDGFIADGSVTGGMQVKLENCKAAMDAGVKRIHLISGFRENALRSEIFEPTGPGTMLIPEATRESYENEVAAQKLVEGK